MLRTVTNITIVRILFTDGCSVIIQICPTALASTMSELPVGVTRFRNKYKAEIMRGGQRHYLGVYNTVEMAAAARKEAELLLGPPVSHVTVAEQFERSLAADHPPCSLADEFPVLPKW